MGKKKIKEAISPQGLKRIQESGVFGKYGDIVGDLKVLKHIVDYEKGIITVEVEGILRTSGGVKIPSRIKLNGAVVEGRHDFSFNIKNEVGFSEVEVETDSEGNIVEDINGAYNYDETTRKVITPAKDPLSKFQSSIGDKLERTIRQELTDNLKISNSSSGLSSSGGSSGSGGSGGPGGPGGPGRPGRPKK